MLLIISCEDEEAFINHKPIIDRILTEQDTVMASEVIRLTVIANDEDADKLYYHWSCLNGQLDSNDSIAYWTSPEFGGRHRISCTVTDSISGADSSSKVLTVFTVFQLYKHKIQGDWEWVYTYGSQWGEEWTITPETTGRTISYSFVDSLVTYYSTDQGDTLTKMGTYEFYRDLYSPNIRLFIRYANYNTSNDPIYFTGNDSMFFDTRASCGSLSAYVK